MSGTVSDAAARSRALDPEASFCVQAPAGSGKTELLTQRILSLLVRCDLPEEILAFTFTRKAAAEMRNRLLGSLEAAVQADSDSDQALPPHAALTRRLARAVLQRDQECGWQLLQNSQRLRINTIDSFTSWLTSRLPLAAGFGTRPAISTDMQEVFSEAVRNTLNKLNEAGPYRTAVSQLLTHLHGNLLQAQNLLMALLALRDQWLPLLAGMRDRADLEANLSVLISEVVSDAAGSLQYLQKDIMRLVNFAAEQLAVADNTSLSELGFTAEFPEQNTDCAGQWQALAALFLTADHSRFLSKPTRRHGFPGKSNGKDAAEKQYFADMLQLFSETVTQMQADNLLPFIQQLAGLPPARYNDAQWQVLSDLIGLLPLLAAELQLAMSEAGVIDHTETALAALQALGSETEPTDLALLLDYRIRHLLIDEFQDTSTIQFELLKLLTAGWTPGDGRSLFIVGDGMQSCYGFRNANVGLFLRAREQVGNIDMQLLQLQVNFRSSPQIVDWVNQVFSQAFPATDDIARGGVSYSASQAREQAEGSSGVHCRLLIEDPEMRDKQYSRQYEAALVSRTCKELQQQYPDDSIAILVRSRPCLDALVPALREAGLRWNAEAIDPLLSYPAISDLFTLLSALLSPADITAWLALLRSPLAGLSLADLEILATAAKQEQLTLLSVLSRADLPAALSPSARQRLQGILPLLLRARQLLQTRPLAELLEDLWLSLGGIAGLADNALLDNIATFFQQLDQACPPGELPDLARFKTQLQRSYGSVKHSDVKLQIMTIHKAKGLEFDHVILPALERSGKSNSQSLLLWQEYPDRQQRIRPLLGLVASKGDEEDALYRYLRSEAAQRQALETTRLMYIAVTRAVKTAWLSGIVRQTKEQLTCAKNSLLSSILPVLNDAPAGLQVVSETIAQTSGTEMRQPAADVQYYRKLPDDWQDPAALQLLPAPVPAEAPEVTHDLQAAVLGELLHLSLQNLVSGQQQIAEADFTPAWWLSRLRPFYPDSASLQQAISELRRQLQACLASEVADWLFRQQHQDNACELPLTDYRSGYRKDYVIDRTFVDEQGVRWIIDYKSSRPAEGQSLQQFIAEQTERYQKQLTAYAGLFGKSGSSRLRLALFFTALPLFHEVSAAQEDSLA